MDKDIIWYDLDTQEYWDKSTISWYMYMHL